MENITAIILTLNEEKNIEECIKSIKSIVKRIVVVDGFKRERGGKDENDSNIF